MPNFSGIWSAAQQFQARGQNIWPKPPCAPTAVSATAGNAQATVSFTAPACTGKYPSGVSSYTATSTPGCFTASGAASPLTVTGLSNGTAYTFKVKALGSNGLTGPCSAASGSVTPTNAGSQSYTTAGTYSWVAPACVTSVSVVAVGGGGGGGSGGTCGYSAYGGAGGGGAYKNNISVTPGNSYTVVVGAGGGTTSSGAGLWVKGKNGCTSTFNGTTVGASGGTWGASQQSAAIQGAFLYGDAGGTGGNGGQGDGKTYCQQGGSGYFSGGGGGYAGGGGGGGGGIGLSGTGAFSTSQNGRGVYDGSTAGGSGVNGGSNGTNGSRPGYPCAGTGGNGGAYGGAGGGGRYGGTGGSGGSGAVRIIWPGNTRSFPSTCTGSP